MQERCLTPGLLLLTVFLMLVMIPGGPIETRLYDVAPSWVVVTVSILVTILMMAAVFSAFHTRRGGRSALYMAAGEGGAFALLYLLDLLRIAPPSEANAEGYLKVFEIAGLAIAIMLIGSALRDAGRSAPPMESAFGMSVGERVSLIALSVYFGILITIFATIGALFPPGGFASWFWAR